MNSNSRALLYSVLWFSLTTASAYANELHKVARSGDIEAVSALIANGADVLELDKAVGTPLHWAAARGHSEVVQLLLEAGTPVDAIGSTADKFTPLQLAATGGSVATVEQLVAAGADVTYGEHEGSGTALHIAAGQGHTDVVALLLEIGADPSIEVSNGYATLPIHWAASAGETDVVRLFLESGVSVDASSSVGTTALHLAAFGVHPATTLFLIEQGADTEAFSELLETPGLLARAHPDVAAVFISQGLPLE